MKVNDTFPGNPYIHEKAYGLTNAFFAFPIMVRGSLTQQKAIWWNKDIWFEFSMNVECLQWWSFFGEWSIQQEISRSLEKSIAGNQGVSNIDGGRRIMLMVRVEGKKGKGFN